jgi:hypothetical protein
VSSPKGNSQSNRWWGLFVIVLFGCLAMVVLVRRGGTPPLLETPQSDQSYPTNSTELELVSAPETPRASSLSPRKEVRQVAADDSTRECSSNQDCWGPKQAECVVASCKKGHCVADSSACACQTDSECSDDDPCTRDVCFSNTKKCIHVAQDCDQ